VVIAALSVVASLPGERLPYGARVVDLALFLPLAISFATVGALVVWRRPANVIGRLLVLGGVVLAVQFAVAAYAIRALFGAPSLPGGEAAAWIFNIVGVGLGSVFILVVYLFPDGRITLLRTRVGLVLIAFAHIPLVLLMGFRPGPLLNLPAVESPLAIAAVGRYTGELVIIFMVWVIVVLALGFSTLRERARRSGPVGRQQIKWFLAGAAVASVVVTLSGPAIFLSGPEPLPVVRLAVALSLMAIPISIGVAILRYRLYDIDLLIRRTLVYGGLTIALAATYVALVLVVQTALRPFTGGSELAVAASTLATLALVQPLRRRIRETVDRRFYRSRYNAARARPRRSRSCATSARRC